MPTILVTGFGPFPGAPYNPTAALIARLARTRRPALRDCRLIGHVFATRYDAIDRELPPLMAQHRPDALLMFGLAGRTPHLRVELRARNAIFPLLPDAAAALPPGRMIVSGGPSHRPLRGSAVRLLQAVRSARVPAAYSRDAGAYLCNYLYWRALETVAAAGSPRIAVFVHVPKVRRGPRRSYRRAMLSAADLLRAGEAVLLAVAAAARRR